MDDIARAGVFINVVGKVDASAFGKAHAELRRLQAEAQQAGTGIGAAFERARSKMDSVGSSLLSTGAKLTVGVTAPLAFAGKKAFDLASDLAESESKARVVFGRYAGGLEKMAKTAATSMGISRQEFLEGAGTFGNLFRAMEIGQPVAAKMSGRLVGLASDLASFNNANPTEVLEALRSGLTGEVEPLRRFGVNINEARIQAEAIGLGLVKPTQNFAKIASAQNAAERASAAYAKAVKTHGKDSIEARTALAGMARAQDALNKATDGSVPPLSAAQKAQAAYSLIIKDTKLAQGDFQRTSSGAANQQRILTAELKDMGAEIGQKLIPIGQKLLGWVKDLITGFQGLPSGAQNVVLIGAVAAAAAGPVSALTGGVLKLAAGVIGAGQKTVAFAGKVRTGVSALGRFRDGYRDAQAAQSAFSGKLGTLGGKLRSAVGIFKKGGSAALSMGKNLASAGVAAAKQFGAQIARAAIVVVTQWIPSLLASAAAMIAATWPILLIIAAIGLLVAAGIWVWQNWDTVWNAIKATAEAVWEGIQAVISAGVEIVKTIISTYIGIYVAIWDAAWAAVKWIVETVWNGIQAGIDTAMGLVRGIIEGGLGLIRGIWETAWGGISGVVSSIFGGAVDAVRTVLNAIIGAINRFIGFWNGLEFKVPSVDLGPVHIGGGTIGLPDIPKIPTLHTGGIYRAPRGLSEGLALLKDGEAVMTRSQQAFLRDVVSGGNRGPSLVIQVDARGATDPAATERSAESGARAGASKFRQLAVAARGR